MSLVAVSWEHFIKFAHLDFTKFWKNLFVIPSKVCPVPSLVYMHISNALYSDYIANLRKFFFGRFFSTEASVK